MNLGKKKLGIIRSSIQSSAPTYKASSSLPQDAFFLPDFSENRALLELLVSTNILALILALIDARDLGSMSWSLVAQYVFFVNWVTVSFAWLSDLLRSRLRALPRIQAVLWSLLMLEGIIGLTTLLINVGLNVILNMPKPWWEHVLYHLVLGGCLGMVIMRYLYVREQMINQHRAELQARVQVLQARIRPHFLFNTMNSVLSLIQTDPVKAESMIENLAQLFRASLSVSGEISLLDEVALCKNYLDIETIRLGERLRVDWRLPDEDALYDVNIPSLTLQPLLENAIYYGVETFSTPSTISVLLQVNAKDVTIVVTNPCQTGKKGRQSGNGMALGNIQERLQAYYGGKARLQTHQTSDLFTTYLSYPYVAQ
ncbi:sensor histidine kinase [Alkanindiges sp. WGS2144]|uniref:sensor histidine kinase n=1 Tax=Alkanindiges sp. WGS2144 TaxID=3366808 RepID=UPI0037529FE8